MRNKTLHSLCVYIYIDFMFDILEQPRPRLLRTVNSFGSIPSMSYHSQCTLKDIISTKKDVISTFFFILNLKICYKDELPKTLLTIHLTTLLRRYPGEHNILTTLTTFNKKHRTKLKLNIRLQKLHTTIYRKLLS